MKTKKAKRYIIRAMSGSGAAYLAVRKNHSPEGKYWWAKESREFAAVLTESAARHAVNRYGGTLVKI